VSAKGNGGNLKKKYVDKNFKIKNLKNKIWEKKLGNKNSEAKT